MLNSWRDEGSDVYVCAECGKVFETADSLNGHQSAHRDD
ncbi:C2H2-type zinc finger protein [Natrinema salifodinae]